MRVAHISDTHLGFKAYARTHASGVNQRSIDVVGTFRANLASILAHDPDIIVHTGDMFHMVRPDNDAIYQAVAAVTDIQRKRDGRPFVLDGGNHDSPKTIGGNIQRLFTLIPGVRFAGNMAERFDIPEIDTEVLCIPSNSLVAREDVALRPTLGRRYSILCVHGMATQALPKAVELKHADFDVNELHTNLFTYTALGDYHVHAPYAPNCCFAGSTDYTTTNIWDETGTPKGWVLFDTDHGQLQHVAVPTRAVIDLPVIDADGISIDEIYAMMAAAATFDVPMPIVRQKIVNVHPDDRKRIFAGPCVRDIMARCLNYQVATAAPTRDKGTGVVTPTAPGAAVASAGSIENLWHEHAETASLPASVDRGAFINAGLDLLRQAVAA